MAAPPEPTFQYMRPVGAELVQDAPITLDATQGQSVHVKQWCYKGWTVDFSLTHQLEEDAGEYQHVARYDCCHSEVHKHQLYRYSEAETRHTVKQLDDPKTAWEDVDTVFPEAYDDMIDNWEENYRRWNRGRADR